MLESVRNMYSSTDLEERQHNQDMFLLFGTFPSIVKNKRIQVICFNA